MARVAGVDLPPNKRAQIGMTYIYGVGKSRATAILDQAGVGINVRIKDIAKTILIRYVRSSTLKAISKAISESAFRWTLNV